MSILPRVTFKTRMQFYFIPHSAAAKFDVMLTNPAQFEANHPEMDAEDYIVPHESFHLLEPLEERWGKWVSWKCIR